MQRASCSDHNYGCEMPRSPEPTGAVHDNAPETGDNPDQATPPPSADGDHLPVIEPVERERQPRIALALACEPQVAGARALHL